MFSFQTFPQRSPEGWGLFLFLAALSRPGRFGGVDAAQPRDAASERSLLCCGSGSGQARPKSSRGVKRFTALRAIRLQFANCH
jgi:hypothetical protein